MWPVVQSTLTQPDEINRIGQRPNRLLKIPLTVQMRILKTQNQNLTSSGALMTLLPEQQIFLPTDL